MDNDIILPDEQEIIEHEAAEENEGRDEDEPESERLSEIDKDIKPFR
jgi:hypothetical protein